MIYVMSDIHGCFDKYKEMLDKINFGKDDTLYILGDVVDRGEDGIKVLRHMMSHENIIPIIGNHEYMAYLILKDLSVEITEENYDKLYDCIDIMELMDWMDNGGEPTMKGFTALSREDRERVLDYIGDFSSYEELNVNGIDYILVHAGLYDFSPEKDMEEYDIYDLIWERTDYKKVYFKDKIVVTGHTPTVMIDSDYEGRIYKKNNHIAIDCGAVFVGVLGCICLDTMEEFYV